MVHSFIWATAVCFVAVLVTYAVVKFNNGEQQLKASKIGVELKKRVKRLGLDSRQEAEMMIAINEALGVK